MTRPDRATLLSLLLLTVLTLAVFHGVAGNDFIDYDDLIYVVQNPRVNSGLSLDNVAWAFGSGYAANWHPVTWISHMADVQLFGMDPQGHHLVNLVIHALNAGLLFLLLTGLTGARGRSLLVALLFAIHPLHVESVAWVAERKDLLSSCFGLLALLAYAGYARSGDRLRYALVLLFFALSLMSKPMLVTLPFLLLLLDYWPLGRLEPGGARGFPGRASLSRLVAEKLPLFALSALSSCVTLVVQSRGEAVHSLQLTSLSFRIGNALVSYLRYLGKALWPQDLSVLYPLPKSIPPLQSVGSALLLLAVTCGVAIASRRRRYLAVGWLWFLGTLVPVIGLVQVGLQSGADRYTYLPLVGIFIMAAWGVADLAEEHPSLALPSRAAGCLAVLALGCAAWSYQRCWSDSKALFGHAIAATADNYYAHYLLGNALSREQSYREALNEYARARELGAPFADLLVNSGIVHAKLGEQEQAAADFSAALALKPRSPYVQYNLAVSLQKQGRLEEAVRHYREVLREDPYHVEGRYNLALALMSLKRCDEAAAQLSEAIRIRPELDGARAGLQKCGG